MIKKKLNLRAEPPPNVDAFEPALYHAQHFWGAAGVPVRHSVFFTKNKKIHTKKVQHFWGAAWVPVRYSVF